MNDTSLRHIEQLFTISTPRMRRLISDFHREMVRGLELKASSLKMIPTFVDRPTGKERGRFIALDLGGTNFRVLELELKGCGRKGIPRSKIFVLDKRHITGSGKALFDFIAGCVKSFVVSGNLTGRALRLGFTFSFAVDQTGIASGRLIRWTKGFSAKGVLGKDVVKLLEKAFLGAGLDNVTIAALANDTVGTLVSKCYEDPACDVGVIIGTGTNACYSEKIANISACPDFMTRTGRMIINMEWGNFNKLDVTRYDRMLDNLSKNKRAQLFEKMVSGMYLGEIVRLILLHIIQKKGLFAGHGADVFKVQGIFRTEYMSIIEGDHTAGLTAVGNILKNIGIRHAVLEDMAAVKQVCAMVSMRASRLSAAAITAVVTKADPALSSTHTIAIDGSVYEKHPHFASNMRKALREVLGPKSYRIRLALAKDGSGVGAAIIAAVAGS